MYVCIYIYIYIYIYIPERPKYVSSDAAPGAEWSLSYESDGCVTIQGMLTTPFKDYIMLYILDYLQNVSHIICRYMGRTRARWAPGIDFNLVAQT